MIISFDEVLLNTSWPFLADWNISYKILLLNSGVQLVVSGTWLSSNSNYLPSIRCNVMQLQGCINNIYQQFLLQCHWNMKTLRRPKKSPLKILVKISVTNSTYRMLFLLVLVLLHNKIIYPRKSIFPIFFSLIYYR